MHRDIMRAHSFRVLLIVPTFNESKPPMQDRLKRVTGGTRGAIRRPTQPHPLEVRILRLKTVLVENRPGASGNIAAESVAHATPDGYTLFIGTRSNMVHKSVYGRFDFDFASDLTPAALLATVPQVLVTRAQAPIVAVKDMIALAQEHPGVLTCASTGFGSDTHLLCELIQRATHTKLLHVPYRGGAAAISDLIAGRVDLPAFSLPGALPYIKAGSVRALAVTARQPQATSRRWKKPACPVSTWKRGSG
jgi:tripartite-type tricarboxylate transporter receptor subunit TctC